MYLSASLYVFIFCAITGAIFWTAFSVWAVKRFIDYIEDRYYARMMAAKFRG